MEPHRNHPNTCKSHVLLTFWFFPSDHIPYSSTGLHSSPFSLFILSSFSISLSSSKKILGIMGNFMEQRREFACQSMVNMSTSKMLMAFFLLFLYPNPSNSMRRSVYSQQPFDTATKGERKNVLVCEAYESDFLRSLKHEYWAVHL